MALTRDKGYRNSMLPLSYYFALGILNDHQFIPPSPICVLITNI